MFPFLTGLNCILDALHRADFVLQFEKKFMRIRQLEWKKPIK